MNFHVLLKVKRKKNIRKCLGDEVFFGDLRGKIEKRKEKQKIFIRFVKFKINIRERKIGKEKKKLVNRKPKKKKRNKGNEEKKIFVKIIRKSNF